MQRSWRQGCSLPSCFSRRAFRRLATSREPPATFRRSGSPPLPWSPGRPASSRLAAGILILIGFQTRVAALLLAAFCIAAAFIGHYGQGGGDPALAFMHSQALMKDVAIAGGFLALAVAGAGAWSVDALRGG